MASRHCIDTLKSMPVAEVDQVQCGHWINKSTLYRKCSECGCCLEYAMKPFLFGLGEYNYCPNCGAKNVKDGDAYDCN